MRSTRLGSASVVVLGRAEADLDRVQRGPSRSAPAWRSGTGAGGAVEPPPRRARARAGAPCLGVGVASGVAVGRRRRLLASWPSAAAPARTGPCRAQHAAALGRASARRRRRRPRRRSPRWSSRRCGAAVGRRPARPPASLASTIGTATSAATSSSGDGPELAPDEQRCQVSVITFIGDRSRSRAVVAVVVVVEDVVAGWRPPAACGRATAVVSGTM